MIREYRHVGQMSKRWPGTVALFEELRQQVFPEFECIECNQSTLDCSLLDFEGIEFCWARRPPDRCVQIARYQLASGMRRRWTDRLTPGQDCGMIAVDGQTGGWD